MTYLQSEFQVIQRYFNQNKDCSTSINQGIIKGIGDDAAVINVSEQSKLVVSMDTLISGVHFPEITEAFDIGYKALAVNLSDLAAMGASPSWFTLALTLPDTNSAWLNDFSRGLFELAEHYKIALVGGDTTKGPLSITIQIAGYVSEDTIMYRSGAQIDDDIYVTGYLGDAGAGLSLINNSLINNNVNRDTVNLSDAAQHYLVSRLNRPSPRVSVGELIREFSTACIDISDGLMADLNHITDLSHCGALINVENLPISNELSQTKFDDSNIELALNSGDDYELCFCASDKFKNTIKKISDNLDVPITKIGKIVQENSIQCYLNNNIYEPKNTGYEHFKP